MYRSRSNRFLHPARERDGDTHKDRSFHHEDEDEVARGGSDSDDDAPVRARESRRNDETRARDVRNMRVPLSPDPPRARRRALIISINYTVPFGHGGAHGSLRLQNCHRDAMLVREALEASGFGPEELLVLSDENHTLETAAPCQMTRAGTDRGGAADGTGDGNDDAREDDYAWLAGIGTGIDEESAGCDHASSARPARSSSCPTPSTADPRARAKEESPKGVAARIASAMRRRFSKAARRGSAPYAHMAGGDDDSGGGADAGAGPDGHRALEIPPTRENIIDAMAWLTDASADGDFLFLYFAGHATTVRDRSGHRKWASGQQGAIVPMDALDRGLIVDECLSALLLRPLVRGSTLYAIMDCCHAEGLLDLPFAARIGSDGGDDRVSRRMSEPSASELRTRRIRRSSLTTGAGLSAIDRLRPIGHQAARDRGHGRDACPAPRPGKSSAPKRTGAASPSRWTVEPVPIHPPRDRSDMARRSRRGSCVGPGEPREPCAEDAARVTRGDVYMVGASALGQRSLDAGRRGHSALSSAIASVIARGPDRVRNMSWRTLHEWLDAECRDGGGGVAGHRQSVQLETSRRITGRGRALAGLREHVAEPMPSMRRRSRKRGDGASRASAVPAPPVLLSTSMASDGHAAKDTHRPRRTAERTAASDFAG